MVRNKKKDLDKAILTGETMTGNFSETQITDLALSTFLYLLLNVNQTVSSVLNHFTVRYLRLFYLYTNVSSVSHCKGSELI